MSDQAGDQAGDLAGMDLVRYAQEQMLARGKVIVAIIDPFMKQVRYTALATGRAPDGNVLPGCS